ncbi:hypothetical protein PspLS_09451, partial [Pyricularia sp. CBS 133598]
PRARAGLEGTSTCWERAPSADLCLAAIGISRLAPLVPGRREVPPHRSVGCKSLSSLEKETYLIESRIVYSVAPGLSQLLISSQRLGKVFFRGNEAENCAVLHGRVGTLAEVGQHGMTCVTQEYELAILNLVQPESHTICQVTRRFGNVMGPREQTPGIGPQPIGRDDEIPLLRHTSLGADGGGVKVDYGEPYLSIILRLNSSSLAKTWPEYLCTSSSDGLAPAAHSLGDRFHFCKMRVQLGVIWIPAPTSRSSFADSKRVTLWPDILMEMAAERPPMPAPITMTWRFAFDWGCILASTLGLCCDGIVQ